MKIKELADKTRYFKETPEGVSIMCKAIEDMRNEAANMEKYQFAINLLNRGKDTFEEISELTGLTLAEVQQISDELKIVNA